MVETRPDGGEKPGTIRYEVRVAKSMCRILYMKSFLFFLLLLSFLSFAELNHARKEASEYYWKSMTKDQPIPEAIRDLLVRDPAGSDKMKHFVKDFDTKHSAIIYHSPEKAKLKEKNP
uniref:Organ-specific protein S2 n=1 Tax=Salix viminalis TaxID=40686 RepID=A0A6N2L6H6_SALVM